MRLLPCAACDAKDSEIAFLREEVKTWRDMLANVADPLLHARLAAAAAPAEQPAPTPRVHWRFREDRPIGELAPRESNQEIHDSFRREEVGA